MCPYGEGRRRYFWTKCLGSSIMEKKEFLKTSQVLTEDKRLPMSTLQSQLRTMRHPLVNPARENWGVRCATWGQVRKTESRGINHILPSVIQANNKYSQHDSTIASKTTLPTLPSFTGTSSFTLGIILNVIAPWDWAWRTFEEKMHWELSCTFQQNIKRKETKTYFKILKNN